MKELLQTKLSRPMSESQSKKSAFRNSASTRLEADRLIAASKTRTEAELRADYAELANNYQALLETNASLEQTLENRQPLPISQQQNMLDSRTADLHRAENHWRELLENIELIVIGIDYDRKVTYANPFFLKVAGYTADEVIGKDWFDHFVPAAEKMDLETYHRQLISPSKAHLHYQNSILTASGETRTIAWNNTVLRDRQDSVVGTMSIGEDITERAAIASMKAEFVAMVSHELRTPLTSIHGGIKLITQDIVPIESAQAQQLLQIAASNSQRLVRLVDDILTLESLTLKQNLLKKQKINTHTLIQQAVESFQLMLQKHSVGLEVCDLDLEIDADSDRLTQVLINLIDNAIKFSPAGSTIKITVAEKEEAPHPSSHSGAMGSSAMDRYAHFSVRDSGKGIPKQQQARVFERFVQVEAAEARKQGGTGLGLAICRGIIEQHNGKIWVESAVGKGSCFHFTLPIK